MSKRAEQAKGRAARLARLLPSGPSNAARTPFVLLVVLLLGGGLISLLVLNSALNEGSFRLSELKRETTELTDEQQALQRDVDSYSEPDALERRARKLGMVPGGSPAFLEPDGTVRGVPSRTAAEPVPTPGPEPETEPEASPSGTPAASSTPTGTPGSAVSPSSSVPAAADTRVSAPAPRTTPSTPPTAAASSTTLPGR